MLPRTVTDDVLRTLFEPFGPLDEVSVLHGPDGTSKGPDTLPLYGYGEASGPRSSRRVRLWRQGQAHAYWRRPARLRLCALPVPPERADGCRCARPEKSFPGA